MIMTKTLLLTLKKAAFDVMVTGEKTIEYRKKTKWIESRIFDKGGMFRQYDFVKFVNGYGADKPYFVCKYKGSIMRFGGHVELIKYSNGLSVEVWPGDYEIHLGEIIETGNL